mgnify:CR=1 FL=1
MRFRRRLIPALAAGIAGLAGCSRPQPPAEPATLQVAARLAPADAAPGFVPTAVIDDVRHPVLARAEPLWLGAVPAGAGGTLTVPLQRPQDAPATTLRLTASAAGTTARIATPAPPLLADGTLAGDAIITLAGAPAARSEVVVSGRARPGDVVATAAVRIPERALLRLAIGIDDADPPSGVGPVTFRVVAGGDGGDATVFERTVEPGDARARGWHGTDVDIASLGGRTVAFRFETEASPAPDGAFTFPVWGDPQVLARSDSAARRPNFLLISLDTLRQDHVGAYGYRRPTTPLLDARLAAPGVVFERAYTAYPSTPGSHMTLFTALPTCVHGVSGLSFDTGLAPGLSTLPELFRDAGYATAAFVENAWVTHALGFSRGFGTWVENRSPELTEPVGQAEKTFAETADWIDAHRDQPWLVFAHTYQVHHPHTPPPGYLERVTGDAETPSATATEKERDLYDAEIRYTDDLLGRLLDRLQAADELRDTVIVLFSDHGEHFGEHGQHRHGFSLYEELLRVPLVVYGPGVFPGGKRIGAEVGLIDVLPTMTELAGIATPPGLQGRSLVPLLRGESLPSRTLFAELPLLGLVAARRDGQKILIDTKQQKAWTTDVGADPREQAVRASFDDPTTAAALAEYQRSCAVQAPQAAGTRAPTEALDPEVRRKLEALGYAD